MYDFELSPTFFWVLPLDASLPTRPVFPQLPTGQGCDTRHNTDAPHSFANNMAEKGQGATFGIVSESSQAWTWYNSIYAHSERYHYQN